jgi:hypothetical protein
MAAMEEELGRSRKSQQTSSEANSKTSSSSKHDKGKGKGDPSVEGLQQADGDIDLDVEEAMEAELQSVLDTDEFFGGGTDYNLIKNFLESFKSQGGLSGPVGNLAGRLQNGWQMPRDDS